MSRDLSKTSTCFQTYDNVTVLAVYTLTAHASHTGVMLCTQDQLAKAVDHVTQEVALVLSSSDWIYIIILKTFSVVMSGKSTRLRPFFAAFSCNAKHLHLTVPEIDIEKTSKNKLFKWCFLDRECFRESVSGNL